VLKFFLDNGIRDTVTYTEQAKRKIAMDVPFSLIMASGTLLPTTSRPRGRLLWSMDVPFESQASREAKNDCEII